VGAKKKKKTEGTVNCLVLVCDSPFPQ